MKKKKSLWNIFLIPILIIVFVQGAVPFLTLIFSGIRSNMENAVIGLDSHTVENRKVVLENDMIEQWSSVYKESDSLSSALTKVLSDHQMDMQGFMGSGKVQEEYLETVFYDMVEVLQYNSTSGIFLVLGNDGDTDSEGEYKGFWVRDSDPQTKTASRTDLLMERGSKVLSQNMSISLDTSWHTDFHFQGNGKRDADDFFYQPYITAENYVYSHTSMENLGYWSKPFILEEFYKDNHKMITYSAPLVYDKTVYGVLGIEVGVNDLTKFFPVKDLDSDLNAGFALVVDHGNGNYEGIAGEGALYDAVSRDGSDFVLEEPVQENLRLVQGAAIGKQQIYGLVSNLELYSRNVPYEDTQWALCGFVTEDSVYGLISDVYERILGAILGSALMAVILVYFLVQYATEPVYHLVESVRGGVKGIHGFQESGIQELDELHKVIENLTDTQMQTENQLLEEKERYRIAVESSQDAFFTYKCKEKLLEIVNSKGNDGVWDCGKHPEFLDNDSIHPADKAKLVNAVKSSDGVLDVDFRLQHANGEFQWVNLSGSITFDENKERSRVVGCIHNVHQHKLLEQAQKRKQIYDSITSFYRLGSGLEVVETLCRDDPEGVLVLLEIQQFSKIDERYGLIFGDIILEQFAGLLAKRFQEDGLNGGIYIRAGADQMLVWLPVCTTGPVVRSVQRLETDFGALTDEKYLSLSLKCGIAVTGSRNSLSEALEQTKTALTAARHGKQEIIFYEELSTEEKACAVDVAFAEVASLERLKEMTLSSIALNLFDRDGDTSVVLDILALKLQEKYHLTDAQIQTIQVYEDGFKLDYSMPNGEKRYHGYCALEGGIMDLGPDPVPREPLDTRYNVHHGDRSDGVFKYFIMKDKNWKLIDHDYYKPDEKLYHMLMEASSQYDVSMDFDEFVSHGGKLILFTSWNDMSISPWQIINQYQKLVKKYGQKKADSFMKFYCMPSATHCSGIRMDYLEWLDTWCSEEKYPEETLYGVIEKTGGEMPMATFPGWVKYKDGDPLKGTSYEVSYEIPEGFFDNFA